MLACARLGVIHSQVFGGFSGTACADRIVDSQQQRAHHHGFLLSQRHPAGPQAECRCGRRNAAKDGQKVDKVLVWQRYAGKYSAETPMVDGRDFFVNDLLKNYYGARVEPERMNSG
jgi:acetyl-CoA synthetase